MRMVVVLPDGRPAYAYEGTADGGIPIPHGLLHVHISDLRLVDGTLIHDPQEPDHGREKTAAIERVNTLAEAARGRHMTLGAGQALVYQTKRREAEALITAPRGVDASKVPFIAVRAARRGVAIEVVAAEVRAKAIALDELLAAIEDVREAAIDAITAIPITDHFRTDLSSVIDGLIWP